MSEVEWIRADWPAPAGIVAGTTLRNGGASTGRYASLNLGSHVGDAKTAVEVNRQRFVRDCGLPAEPRWLSQVHGTRVVPAGQAYEGIEADAIFTGEPDAVCAVLTADCLPVLFASGDGLEVAAAHAGWRGLAAGILEATVQALATPPPELLAWLGPAISRDAFEVGDEVREAFLAESADAAPCFEANARGRWQADLYGLASRRLERAGVSRVFGGGRCTFGEPESFFSWRRDGECGRMASFIVRDGKNA